MPKAEKTFHGAAYRRFIALLKQARAEAELTQREVAKKLGRSHNFITKVESGQRRIDVVELKALAKVYRKPVSFFLAD